MKYNKDFLNDVFNLLEFTSEQKDQALSELNLLIKAKIINELINNLPTEDLSKINSITDIDSEDAQQQLTEILLKTFSKEQVQIEEKKTIAEAVLFYIDCMFADGSEENKKKVRDLLTDYHIGI